jgi:hypothetical protein
MRGAKRCLVGLTGAALIFGTLATGVVANAASAGSAPFSDISGSADATAITWLATIGAVNGVGNGLYDPSAPVTRQQMAKMVVNMIGKGSVAAALANTPSTFTDGRKIEPDLLGYVNVAADLGIVDGYPDGSFRPNQPVTDAEAAAMILRAIGDNQSGVISGTWPGNYVSAALGGSPTAPLESDGVDLASGVSFVANLPASRGDVAQMLYNAAIFIPVYTSTTSSTGLTSFTAGKPLYQQGSVGGFTAVVGTVGAASTTSIAVGGTSYDWASTYQMPGISSLSALMNQSVVLTLNSSGDAVFVALAPGAAVTSNTGTLANASTTVPSGYFQVNSDWPFLLTSAYDCSDGYTGANITTLGGTVDGTACGSTYYLLLGGSSPTTVQLATYGTATSGTTYEVNPASDGSDPGTVPGVTYLTQGDSVSYTLNSNKEITLLTEANANDSIGVVTSTACASGCDTTINAGATPQLTLNINGSSYTVNVQPYTTLTLNGASATVSKSLDNDVAYVSTVGGYGTYDNASNPGTGDNNATTVSLYNNQVTGSVTSVDTSSNAPNFSSSNPQGVVSFTLSLSNGSSETYTADANFNANGVTLNYGEQVTVALDAAGEAAYIISTTASSAAAVALVTSTGQQISATGTTYTLIVNDATGSGETLQLSGSATCGGQPCSPYTAEGGTVYNSVYWNTYGNGNNGFILYQTNAQGDAVAPGSQTAAPTPMQLQSLAQLFPKLNAGVSSIPATDYLQVVSASSSGAVIGLYNSSGQLDYATTTNPFFSVVNGGAFDEANNPATWIGSFSGLDTAEGPNSVAVYEAATQSGVPYYAIVSIQ